MVLKAEWKKPSSEKTPVRVLSLGNACDSLVYFSLGRSLPGQVKKLQATNFTSGVACALKDSLLRQGQVVLKDDWKKQVSVKNQALGKLLGHKVYPEVLEWNIMLGTKYQADWHGRL